MIRVANAEKGAGGHKNSMYRIFASYTCKVNILYLSWIAENIIMIVCKNKDDHDEIRSYFAPHFLNKEQSPLLSIVNMKENISHFLFEKSSFPLERITNSISVDFNKRHFNYLSENTLYYGLYFNWKEFIDLLIDKAEWLFAFSICLDIYRGDN